MNHHSSLLNHMVQYFLMKPPLLWKPPSWDYIYIAIYWPLLKPQLPPWSTTFMETTIYEKPLNLNHPNFSWAISSSKPTSYWGTPPFLETAPILGWHESLQDMGLAEELLLAMWSGMASGATEAQWSLGSLGPPDGFFFSVVSGGWKKTWNIQLDEFQE